MVEVITILVADDHTVVREGLAAMLAMQEDFAVVGEAGNGLEATAKALELRPDVILMDIRMPEMDGVEAIRRIRDEDSQVKVIVLTTFDSDDYIFQSIDSGAAGYLLKDCTRDELFQAVRAAHRGENPLQASVVTKVLSRLSRLSHGRTDTEALSEREVEVLRLIAQGAANKEIAATLGISPGTARSHVANIFQKLAVRDRTEAVIKAAQKGIISL